MSADCERPHSPQAEPPIGFAPPFIDEETIAAVERVLRSGWITTGPETAAFERELAAYVRVNHVVCGGSWTGLAGVVLDWLGVGPGDEVILPAYTYCATANVVLHRGATPVLVDLPEDGRKDGLNIAWEQVAPLLSPRTKVVMPVDIGGWPVDGAHWKAKLESWTDAHGFQASNEIQKTLGRPLLLSDAAHSLGARVADRPVGGDADITIFSFHAVKNLTTAEGGAAALALPDAFSSEEVYRTLRSHGLHGQTKDAAAKFKQGGKGQWRYDVTHPGFKCNMTDIQAAMGRVALSRYDQDQDHRKQLADAYDRALVGRGLSLPVRKDGTRTSADHLYVILLEEQHAHHRDEIMGRMAEDGIATNVHFPPLPLLTAYAQIGYDIKAFPHAHQLYLRAISLPLHLSMSEADVARVVRSLERAMHDLTSANIP
jgi:dTDP-4-amino-4,6-dideoxygalactose transaminase